RARHRRRGARGPLHRRRQRHAAGAGPRLLRRAGHLRAGAVRAAARGHRRGHPGRPRAAQPGRPRTRRRRRLTVAGRARARFAPGGGPGPTLAAVIRLDAATVLLQWAVGGLLFLWVTTRGREVGVGYGWLLRGTYLLMAAAAVAVGLWLDPVPVRAASGAAVVVATGVALAVSVARRRAGVAGERARLARRTARVAAMTGIDRRAGGPDPDAPEFPPALDLVAPLVGVPGLVAAGVAAGDPALLSVARVLVGAAFLGSVSDAMLLG